MANPSTPSPMGFADEVAQLMQMPQSLCKQRGICCKVAVFKGLHSTEAIIEMAETDPGQDGEMARDFRSVFLPYESIEDVVEIAPEFVERVLDNAEKNGLSPHEIGFFHCRYVSDEGRCMVHEDRPIGCRKYPIPHPKTIFHPGCGYEEQSKDNWSRIYEILTILGIQNEFS